MKQYEKLTKNVKENLFFSQTWPDYTNFYLKCETLIMGQNNSIGPYLLYTIKKML